MNNNRLKILAEHYFYPWEIEEATGPGKLVEKASESLRGTYHSGSHSFSTSSDKTVVFWLKGNSTEPDIKTSVEELAQSLFKQEEQLSLF